jgi:predicted TIM-barrel fold metal-dependent hydrolase
MIIDCHCHAGKGDGLIHHWSTDAPLGPYLRRARAAGIDRTVILAAHSADYARANAGIARIIARHPGRLIGFACVHARRDAGRIRELVGQAVMQWGFRGIKVHRAEAPATREIAETARAYRLPVLYDITGQAWYIEMIAAEYPDVDFIIPHLGSFADDWRAHRQVIDQLVRLPNVYADTSGVKRFDYVVEAVRRGGAHKVLFGSDGPWLHPALELAKIRLLGLPARDEARVLGGNLLRLLGKAAAPTQVPRARQLLPRPRRPARPSSAANARDRVALRTKAS